MSTQQTDYKQNILLTRDILTNSSVEVIVEDDRYKGELATKVGRLISLIIRCKFPDYLTNDHLIFANFSETQPGYAWRAKQYGTPKSFLQLSFNEKILKMFIENAITNLRPAKYLETLEQKLDYLLNYPKLSEYLVQSKLILLTRGQISHIYHELMHNFINRIYETSANLINIEELSEKLEEHQTFIDKIYEKIIARLGDGSWGGIDYAELIEANNIALVQTLIEHCKDEQEAFASFTASYNVGVQELWIRLEVARADYYLRNHSREKPLYPNAESIINELRDYNYIGQMYLPGVEKVSYLQKLTEEALELTPEIIDKYIKETIIPMLDRNAIKLEWERLKKLSNL